MGCFCRHIVVPPLPAFDASLAAELTVPPIVASLSAHLSARWLPAALPWAPSPDWLHLQLPTLALSGQAVSTMMGLINARAALMLAFNLDPLLPAHQLQLTRIVATLNLRLPLLASLAADWQPWSALAMLNGQLDTIQAALTAKLFDPAHIQLNLALAASANSPALPSWRALLSQLLALAPVLAMATMLKLDLTMPGALAQLSVTIRGLRSVTLPALAMPHVVMKLIARNDAVLRLQASLGALPFLEMRLVVLAKLRAVLALLPPGLSVGATGSMLGMPMLLPNPSLLINAPTIAAAGRLSASVAAGLNWSIPAGLTLPLLTVGAPVASLTTGLAGIGVTADASVGLGPVRLTPCNAACDAAKAAKEAVAALA